MKKKSKISLIFLLAATVVLSIVLLACGAGLSAESTAFINAVNALPLQHQITLDDRDAANAANNLWNAVPEDERSEPAVATARTTLNGVLGRINELQTAQDLTAAINTRISAIETEFNNRFDEDDYTEANWTTLQNLLEAERNAIRGLSTVAAVQAYTVDWVPFDAVPQIEAGDQALIAARAYAVAELQTAFDELTEGFDPTDPDQYEMLNLFEAELAYIIAEINALTTVEAVENFDIENGLFRAYLEAFITVYLQRFDDAFPAANYRQAEQAELVVLRSQIDPAARLFTSFDDFQNEHHEGFDALEEIFIDAAALPTAAELDLQDAKDARIAEIEGIAASLLEPFNNPDDIFVINSNSVQALINEAIAEITAEINALTTIAAVEDFNLEAAAQKRFDDIVPEVTRIFTAIEELIFRLSVELSSRTLSYTYTALGVALIQGAVNSFTTVNNLQALELETVDAVVGALDEIYAETVIDNILSDLETDLEDYLLTAVASARTEATNALNAAFNEEFGDNGDNITSESLRDAIVLLRDNLVERINDYQSVSAIKAFNLEYEMDSLREIYEEGIEEVDIVQELIDDLPDVEDLYIGDNEHRNAIAEARQAFDNLYPTQLQTLVNTERLVALENRLEVLDRAAEIRAEIEGLLEYLDIVEADYSDEGWVAIEGHITTALGQLNQALGNMQITLEYVNSSWNSNRPTLIRALGAVPTLIEELRTSIAEQIEGIADDFTEGNYTAASWTAANAVLTEAITDLATLDLAALQAWNEVAALTAAFENALETIAAAETRLRGEITSLINAIVDDFTECDYTPASWTAANAVLTEAIADLELEEQNLLWLQTWLANSAINLAEISADFEDALETTAAATIRLRQEIAQQIDGIADDFTEGNYTPASWAAALEVLTDAILALEALDLAQLQAWGTTELDAIAEQFSTALETATVVLTGVTISIDYEGTPPPAELNALNDTLTLIATIAPANAANITFQWAVILGNENLVTITQTEGSLQVVAARAGVSAITIRVTATQGSVEVTDEFIIEVSVTLNLLTQDIANRTFSQTGDANLLMGPGTDDINAGRFNFGVLRFNEAGDELLTTSLVAADRGLADSNFIIDYMVVSFYIREFDTNTLTHGDSRRVNQRRMRWQFARDTSGNIVEALNGWMVWSAMNEDFSVDPISGTITGSAVLLGGIRSHSDVWFGAEEFLTTGFGTEYSANSPNIFYITTSLVPKAEAGLSNSPASAPFRGRINDDSQVNIAIWGGAVHPAQSAVNYFNYRVSLINDQFTNLVYTNAIDGAASLLLITNAETAYEEIDTSSTAKITATAEARTKLNNAINHFNNLEITRANAFIQLVDDIGIDDPEEDIDADNAEEVEKLALIALADYNNNLIPRTRALTTPDVVAARCFLDAIFAILEDFSEFTQYESTFMQAVRGIDETISFAWPGYVTTGTADSWPLINIAIEARDALITEQGEITNTTVLEYIDTLDAAIKEYYEAHLEMRTVLGPTDMATNTAIFFRFQSGGTVEALRGAFAGWLAGTRDGISQVEQVNAARVFVFPEGATEANPEQAVGSFLIVNSAAFPMAGATAGYAQVVNENFFNADGTRNEDYFAEGGLRVQLGGAIGAPWLGGFATNAIFRDILIEAGVHDGTFRFAGQFVARPSIRGVFAARYSDSVLTRIDAIGTAFVMTGSPVPPPGSYFVSGIANTEFFTTDIVPFAMPGQDFVFTITLNAFASIDDEPSILVAFDDEGISQRFDGEFVNRADLDAAQANTAGTEIRFTIAANYIESDFSIELQGVYRAEATLINTEQELINLITANRSGDFALAADIELIATVRIGDFNGILDGRGHSITVNDGGSLFAIVGVGAIIRNVEFNITNAGALIGNRNRGLIENNIINISTSTRAAITDIYNYTEGRIDNNIINISGLNNTQFNGGVFAYHNSQGLGRGNFIVTDNLIHHNLGDVREVDGWRMIGQEGRTAERITGTTFFTLAEANEGNVDFDRLDSAVWYIPNTGLPTLIRDQGIGNRE